MAKRYLVASLPLYLALLLYGYSLQLTFTLDDMNNFLSVQATDGLSHWGGDRSFPYYRPMAFSLWKALWGIEQRPFAFYALNLLCFGLTGVLVGQIARRWMRQPFAVLAGCAFVIFPFSYQAVLWISSFFHISLAFFLCLSLWGAMRWLRTQQTPWLIFAWVAALAGAFSHENGVLLGALVTGFMIISVPHKRQKIALVSLPAWGISGLYFILWNSVPRSVDTPIQTRLIINDFPILLHGLVYPFDALAQGFVRWRGDYALPNEQPAQAVWGLLAIILIPMLFWLWRKNRLLFGLFALGWYGLAILPSVLNFDSVYLLGSPRLMLMASIPACWLWSLVLAELWPQNWGKVFAGVLIGLTVLVSLPFLAARRYDSLLLANYFWELNAIVEENHLKSTERTVMLMNAPNYLAPLNQTFLLGSEGNFLLLDNGDYGLLYSGNLQRPSPFDTFAFERQTLKYFRGSFSANGTEFSSEELIALVRGQTDIISTIYTDNGFYPSLVKSPPIALLNQDPALFPEIDLKLIDRQATFENQALIIHTTWQQTESQPIKRFLHVLCNGELIAQRDGYIWNDLYPFSAWRADEIQTDSAEFRFEEEIDPACLQIFTGTYWEMNGQRLTTLDPATQTNFPNDAIPVELP